MKVVVNLMGAVFLLLSILVIGQAIGRGDTLTSAESSRHSKGNAQGYSSGDKVDHEDGIVNLEDYRPYDPSPSSKAKVRPAPIQHGSPVIPYIPNPKPSPPSHSNHYDGPSQP